MVGDGIPGWNAPIDFIDVLTFRRSFKRHHLPDYFFIPKMGEFQGEQGSSKCFNFNCVSISSVSSVQFSCSVVFDSLQPHESQHARPPCPSPTPGVHSDTNAYIWNLERR